jgi:hypothetical protein
MKMIYYYQCKGCGAKGTMTEKRPPRQCHCCPSTKFKYLATVRDASDDESRVRTLGVDCHVVDGSLGTSQG